MIGTPSGANTYSRRPPTSEGGSAHGLGPTVIPGVGNEAPRTYYHCLLRMRVFRTLGGPPEECAERWSVGRVGKGESVKFLVLEPADAVVFVALAIADRAPPCRTPIYGKVEILSGLHDQWSGVDKNWDDPKFLTEFSGESFCVCLSGFKVAAGEVPHVGEPLPRR